MLRTRPPFRADHVGSLLRPAVLKEARERRARGEIDQAALREVEDREIRRIIARQQDIGLLGITDGEFRRSWWHLDFLWGLDGVEREVLGEGITFAGVKTRAEGARVTGKVGFSTHPMLDHFRFVQANTTRLAKITIPSPSAIYGRMGRKAIDDTAYSIDQMDEFFADVGRAYAGAVRAFADAGCRYLQLDEVYIAMLCDPKFREQLRARGDDPERLGVIFADLINAAIADIPADMTVTMHLCRGNYRSTFQGAGAYDPVAELLFERIRVHGYFMEYDTERAGGFEPLRLLPGDRHAVLGLVTTKSGQLEDRGAILRRIDEAARYTDLDRLCLSPQCGFASTEEGNVLAEDDQWAKLGLGVEIANKVWG